MDLVALLVLVSLTIAGLISPTEALSGFSSPAVVTVWAILIISGGLARTGVASILGKKLLQLAGDSELRLLVIIMLTSGILSGFMNTIGVVSLFLPVVLDIARRIKQPPSKLLMPLAFAGLLGGLNTLIGTPPNILISVALKDAGLRPFQMFDFAPVGITVLLTGILYMTLIGRHLLPHRDTVREITSDFESLYSLRERMVLLHLPPESNLHGKSLVDCRLGSALGLNIIAILRDEQTLLSPEPTFILQSSDRLLVEGKLDQLNSLRDENQLSVDKKAFSIDDLISKDVEIAEVKLLPNAILIGQSLKQVRFRDMYQVIVLAIRRGDVIIRTNLENIKILPDDLLLIQGLKEQIDILRKEPTISLTKPNSIAEYKLEERFMVVHVPLSSFLVGKSLSESQLSDLYGIGVLGIIRKDRTHLIPSPDEKLQPRDKLLVKGKQSSLELVTGLQNLIIETDPQIEIGELESEEIGLVEAILSPHSRLAGTTLSELNFRFKYGLSVLAIWREGRAYRSNLRDIPLRFGDALLLYGQRNRLSMLGNEPDFMVLTEGAQISPKKEKIPIALLIMGVVLIPVIFGWISIAISAIVGVTLMVLTGCLTMDEAYRTVNWKAVFLIAGMLPLGIAMEQTGASHFLARGVIGIVGDYGPVAVMAGFFILASLASQFMPNPAVAVLLAPIALSTATDLGISPYSLMMTVAVSASAAFLSPVGHSVNLLVMGPGGYRFSDYVKVGFPLTILVFVVVLIAMPIFWPF